MSRLESPDLPAEPDDLTRRLFPFRILIEFAPEPRIVEAGEALQRWIDVDLAGRPFADYFTIIRPSGIEPSMAAIGSRTSDVFFVATPMEGRQLRGQFVALDDRLLFVGSPVVTAASSIEKLGLSLSQLATHDATADIIFMAQFAAMQIKDLERQAGELREALAARDSFSHEAATDPLTDLANRRALWDRSTEALAVGGDEPPPILIYIDVDGFKAINDEHGHQIGDEVLKVLAKRMISTVRTSDLAARLGGDEFAIILNGIREEQGIAVVERLRQALTEDVTTEAGLLPVSVSIGATLVTGQRALEDLMRDADTAMYIGRSGGQGQITWFEPRMGTEREERRLLTHDLRRALEKRGIRAVFQPIVEAATGRLVAFEALARWHHPMRGPIGPDVFVDVAERAGLIEQLDRQILELALTAMSRWQETQPELRLQVNLSGRSIGPDLPGRIAAALARSGVLPGALTIEVTESWFIDENHVTVLEELVALGVQLDLDDFGTGYSSLAHLQAFPISGVKVDRSFVGRMLESERDRRLVAATVSMARSLGLEVVAEGVETSEIAAQLVKLGCPFAQGYLYSHPLPVEDADALVANPDRRLGQEKTVTDTAL